MFNRRIWEIIGNKKNCSFKVDTQLDTLCKNTYNVTGICDEFSCPLANSKYATVRAEGDKLYLYIKEPERCHTPKKMYEQIELDADYNKALMQIEEHLEFWDAQVIHKCKQRMTKLTEYLERLQHAKEHGTTEFMVRKTKTNRREKIRALRALNSLNFEKEIGAELMQRLEAGIYGEESKVKYEMANEKYKKRLRKRYVADFEESDAETDNGKKKKKKEKELEGAMEW